MKRKYVEDLLKNVSKKDSIEAFNVFSKNIIDNEVVLTDIDRIKIAKWRVRFESFDKVCRLNRFKDRKSTRLNSVTWP